MTSSEAAARLLARLEVRAGLVFPAPRTADVVQVAEEVARVAGMPVDALGIDGSDEGAWRALVERLTIGETYFLRDVAPIEHALAALAPIWRASSDPIRIWCAGCSSGEEAYSVAMLLADTPFESRVSVLGTDVSGAAIERARAGTYRDWSLRGARAADARRWLEPAGDRLKVVPRIAGRVRFETLNLVEDPYPTGCELVLCRNVLLYFSRGAAARVLERFGEAIPEHGLVVCAATDPVPDRIAGLERVSEAPSVVLRRAVAHPAVAQPAVAQPAPLAPRPEILPRAEGSPPEVRVPVRPPDVSPPPAGAPGPLLADAEEARARLERGDLVGARRMVEGLLARDLLDPAVHHVAALIALAEGATVLAEQSLQRALYVDPDAPAPRWLRAVLLARRGRRRAAGADLRHLVAVLAARDPQAPVPLTDHTAGSLRREAEALARHIA